nr:unnamed protein product [Digitaria exilis]
MARSAAARLLAGSARSFSLSHHHHHAHHHRRPLFLVPSSRSNTSSSKLPRPSPGREPGSSLFHEISDLVGPADSGAALRHETNDEACRHDHGAAASARRAEGARGIAPESGTAASSSVFCGISDTDALGGLPGDGSQAPGTVESAVNPDIDTISEAVHRVTQVLRSQPPGSSMEQRLESLGVTYTPQLVSMVLKRCFKVRQLGFWFFHWVKRVPRFSHTTETYNTMLYITGEARNFAIMEELVGEMDREMCPKDIKTWTIILSSYGKAGHIGKMLSTFEAMRKSGSVRIDSKVYRTVLHALCSAEKPELAFEFYKDMPRNMEVGTDILRLLMCCVAKTDNAAEAVCSIRDDMIKGMKHPEEYCYMEALRSFCISGKLEEAWKVFQHMKSKSMANSCAFENLLRGLCKAGRMDEALKVVEYMKGTLGINSTAFSFLINGYLRNGEHTKALDLLRRNVKDWMLPNCGYMEYHGLPVWQCWDQYMYGSLIHALLRRYQFDDAVAKLTEMKESGIPQSTHIYTSFVVYYFRKRDVVRALDVLKEMKENGCEPTVVTYSALIRGYMAMSMVSEAWDVFQQMKLKGPAPDFGTYSMFIKCLCKAGRSEHGLQLIHDMMECGFIPSTVNFMTVVHGLNMEGKHALAESALRSKWHLQRQRIISY